MKEFDFSEVAQRVANKLLKKYEGKLPARALQDKIIQNLTNKGFSYSDSKNAFDQLDSQVDQETYSGTSSSRNLISNILSIPENMKDTNLNNV